MAKKPKQKLDNSEVVQASWIVFNNEDGSPIEQIEKVRDSCLQAVLEKYGKESEEYYFLQNLHPKLSNIS